MDLRETYQHSGQLGAGLVLAPIFGIVCGIIGAFAYAYVDVYSPVVGVVSFFFAFGFSFAVGWSIARGARLGHCRNPTFLYVIGAVVGMITLYVAWVAFEWVLGRNAGEALGLADLIGLMLSPLAVWEIAKQIGETGWYSIGSSDSSFSGIMLWLTWIGEAAILVGVPAVVAGSSLDDDVYCEQSRGWVPRWPRSVPLRLPADVQAFERIAAGKIDDLESLEAAGDEEAPRLDIAVWENDSGQGTAAYQLRLQTVNVDKDGEVKVEEKQLGPKLLATPQILERLRALGERQAAPLPEAPPTEDGDQPATDSP